VWGAVFSGASSILGGFAASSAAKARNRAARREYERRLEIRKRKWFQDLSIYGAKVNKYTTDLNENDLAANRGYAQAQAALGRAQSKALAQSQDKFINYVNTKLGKRIATGATGRGVARLQRMDFAKLGRAQADLAFKLTRSKEAYDSQTEAIRNQQKSQRNKLFGSVMFTPVASVPPNAPQMENTTMPILQGFLGAAASFAGAMETKTGLEDIAGGDVLSDPELFGPGAMDFDDQVTGNYGLSNDRGW